MASVRYRGRRAVTLENDQLRITVLEGGGHIAEVFHKPSGVNPLWTPPWPSIDPAAYDPEHHPAYGDGVDASLLAGIMGHNLCLDIFGGPSAEEAAAGLPVHGEVSTLRFDIARDGDELVLNVLLPMARLQLERRVTLGSQPGTVRVRETVANLSAIDHPVGWTEHVTLGPPFLERGATQFRASAGRSKVFPGAFGPADYLEAGAEFDWPSAPRTAAQGGGTADLRVFTGAPVSSAYTAHLMGDGDAFFVAFSPRSRLAFGYVWRGADFPWLGIWEENASRAQPPWNGQTLTRGMEFGVSPFPETRREMIERQRLFGVPTFRWIPAASRVTVEYWIVAAAADAVPETLAWPRT